MLESHASSVDEKPSMWSQVSSSILTMLSTRSSVSETCIVVVIFSSFPLEKRAPDELQLYRTPLRWLSATIIRRRAVFRMACLPEPQRYVGESEAPTFVTFCELNFMGGGYGPAFYRIDCVGIVAWSYRSLLRRGGAKRFREARCDILETKCGKK